jgi:hypothetical protein
MASSPSRHVSSCRVDIPAQLKTQLFQHLFPGDHDEHGAVLAASLAWDEDRVRLLVRHVILAEEGVDYVPGVRGYRRLRAEFVHRALHFCRDHGLAYIAVHNHSGSDRVAFSSVDLNSHERGYPALLDLMQGLPVGALVFASRAAAGDIWWRVDHRTAVSEVRVIGHTIERLRPAPETVNGAENEEQFDRQVRFFGSLGQSRLALASVGVIGAGGAGSLIVEYLARLGVGTLIVADPDEVERSNLSRIVGAVEADATEFAAVNKTEVAQRVAKAANPNGTFVGIPDSVVRQCVAEQFRHCDFMFLAADTASARLVFNAIAQQYYVPGIQVGAKITANPDTGRLTDVFSVLRWVLPGFGCLWCSGLISPYRLAWEAKTDRERGDQSYGSEAANPSVITLNAVAASHAVNEFLLSFQGLRADPDQSVGGYMWHHLSQRTMIDEWRQTDTCLECRAVEDSRFGRGDGSALPTTY